MYRITCDGFPLLDWRDNDLILADPKVSLEVNTVGEGSFTIFKNHPHFDKLKKMKSVVEVSDETGVIFRGRATGDTVDFDHGANVDLEGVMAFFNDSLVRPFNFPGDFKENADYLTAEASGDRVAFFLGWLIDNHNAQVQDFQKLKLGNVTVRDSKLVRSSDQYASTWAMIKAKLFDSSLGGFLCIRYEEDGNYIDYLSEFTETNSQEIIFGENLLDLRKDTEASGIYTAIVPFGALGLTLAGVKDGDITDDIVKSGDTLYSRKAVDQFGWIYAPTESTTWEEVVDDADLLKAGVEWLAKGGAFLNALEATAVDLHFTDAQIESLRLYKNVKVHSEPHGLAEIFPLSRLEIDLLHSQNTKITVGKTLATWTEQAAQLQDEVKLNFSKLSKTDEQIKLEVVKTIGDLGTDENGDPYTVASKIEMTAESITQAVNGYLGTDEDGNPIPVSSSIETALGSITLEVTNGTTSSSIKLLVGDDELDSGEIKMTGVVTIEGLENGTTTIDGGWIKTDSISADALHLTGLLTVYSGQYKYGDWVYDEELGDFVQAVIADIGGYIGFDDGYNSESGIGIRDSGGRAQVVCTEEATRISFGDAQDIRVGGSQVVCNDGSVLVEGHSLISFKTLGSDRLQLDGNALAPTDSTLTCGTAFYPWADVYAAGTSMSDLLERVKALESA